jgi:hypothetical protein
MKDKELARKLKSKLRSLTQDLDAVGPTPLRQLVDAHLVLCYNAIATFDQDAYETDAAYAYKCELSRAKACNLNTMPWK